MPQGNDARTKEMSRQPEHAHDAAAASRDHSERENVRAQEKLQQEQKRNVQRHEEQEQRRTGTRGAS